MRLFGFLGVMRAVCFVALVATLALLGVALSGTASLSTELLAIAAATILLLALLGMLLATAAVERPLAALTEEAEAIRQFNLAESPPIATRFAEVSRLVTAMTGMKKALRTLGVYVPRSLVRKLVREGVDASLGGERRVVTVMFTDVQGFTGIAETMDPVELMRVTSTYFEVLTQELLERDATIDKYIGDAIMAVWNAPHRDLAHAMHACHAALRARAMSLELERDFPHRGWPKLHTRFGLHSGEAVVGNVGSSDRMSFTVIGSVVNLASRLEGLSKYYGTQILVSDATRRGAGNAFVFRPVDLVMAKGSQEPIEIFELCGLAKPSRPEDKALVADAAITANAPHWQRMLACYRAGQFAEAQGHLDACRWPQPDPVAQAYADRLRDLRQHVPEGWTPVMQHQAK